MQVLLFFILWFFLVSSGDSSCRFVFLVILFFFVLLKSTFSVLHGVIKLNHKLAKSKEYKHTFNKPEEANRYIPKKP